MDNDLLLKLFERPLCELSTSSDVGRLANRINVIDLTSRVSVENNSIGSQADSSTSLLSANDTPSKDMDFKISDNFSLNFVLDETSKRTHAWALAGIVWRIAAILEPEILTQLQNSLNKFLENTLNSHSFPGDTRSVIAETPDLSGAVADLLADMECIGKALPMNNEERVSPTLQIFKMLNQSALACGNTQFKLGLCSQPTFLPQAALITKDIRSSDGWRINIEIGNENVIVTHFRKEQSLGPPVIPDNWTIEYSMRIVFSRDMIVLRSSHIQVDSVTFGSLMPTNISNEIRRLFLPWMIQPFVDNTSQKVSESDIDTNLLEPLNVRDRNYCCHCILS